MKDFNYRGKELKKKLSAWSAGTSRADNFFNLTSPMDKSWNKSSGTFCKYIRDLKQRCFWTPHVNLKWTLFKSLQCRHILGRQKLVAAIFDFMTEE